MEKDRDEIRGVLVRYATAIDTRNWTLFRTCFTENASTDYGSIGAWSDVHSIARFMEAAHIDFGNTNHMLSNFVIEVHGDRARATSYVHVVLAYARDPGNWVDSVGRYEDTLVRTSVGWQIAERRTILTRTVTSL
jgi:3-phenylpropionate/cinnamic acid dioxygenase small subunit